MADVQIYNRVAHHGGGNLCPNGNTAEAINLGIDAGCDMVEVDVRVTRDDVLVLEHNVFRAAKGRDVAIKDLALAQWQKVSEEEEGAPPPLATLEEALRIVMTRGAGILLDVKDPGLERLLARLIRGSGIDPRTVMVAVPSDGSRQILRSLDPRLPIAHKIDPSETASFRSSLLDTIAVEGVFWPAPLITKERVAKLAKRDIVVYAGPAYLAQDMRRLRTECKVHGIVAEFPQLLAAI